MTIARQNKIQDAALIVVDVQNDFCTGGNLAVPEGENTVAEINDLRDAFETVVFTKDWHPKGHKSFASAHNAPLFSFVDMPYGKQQLWPDHCVQGTIGAELRGDLDIRKSDLILHKGTNPDVDSYSAFKENDGIAEPKFANGKTLTEEMNERGIKTLVFTGLAGDYCVGFSAEDGLKAKFNVVVVKDAVKAISAETYETKLAALEKAGAKVVTVAELKALPKL